MGKSVRKEVSKLPNCYWDEVPRPFFAIRNTKAWKFSDKSWTKQKGMKRQLYRWKANEMRE